MPTLQDHLDRLNASSTQAYNLTNLVLDDQELVNSTSWDKLLLVMYFGSKYAYLRSEMLILQGGIDPTLPTIADARTRLYALIKIPAHTLLTNRDNFFNFAASAYQLGEFWLIDLAVQFGARLNFNSYFKNLHTEFVNSYNTYIASHASYLAGYDLNAQNQYYYDLALLTSRAQTLDTLVHDTTVRLPWEQKEDFMPSEECSIYLRVDVETPTTPSFFELPAQLVQHLSMQETQPDIVLQTMPLATEGTDTYVQNFYPIEQPEVSQAEATSITEGQLQTYATIETAEVDPQDGSEMDYEVVEANSVTITGTPFAPTKSKNPIVEAVESFNVDICREMLNDPELRAVTFSAIKYFFTSPQATGKKTQKDFLLKLPLALDECITLLLESPKHTAFKAIYLQKISGFDIITIYDYHKSHNILSTLVSRVEKKPSFDSQHINSLKKRIREHEARLVVEAAANIAAQSSVEQAASSTSHEITKKPKPKKVKAPKAATIDPIDAYLAELEQAAQNQPTQTAAPAVAEPILETSAAEIQWSTIFQQAIANNDYHTINSYQFSSVEMTQESINRTIDEILDLKNTFTDEFLLNIALPNQCIVATIVEYEVPRQALRIFLQRIVNFHDEIFFAHSLRIDFEQVFAQTFTENVTDIEKELQTAISNKINNVRESVLQESQHVFEQLQTAQPGDFLQINSYVYAANSINTERQSVLMLALEKRISIENILKLIENSVMILNIDLKLQGIWHYWAKNITNDNVAIMKPLWEKYKLCLQNLPESMHLTTYQDDTTHQPSSINLDPMTLISAQSNDTGDTFMHTLIKHNSSENVLKALRAIFTNDTLQDPSEVLTSSHLLGCALYKANYDDKTPLDLVEEASEYCPHIAFLLTGQIAMLLLPIALQIEHSGQFFMTNRPFFKHSIKNIMRLLQSKEYDRIIQIASLHDGIRLPLYEIPLDAIKAQMPENSRQFATNICNLLKKHFGESEFSVVLDDKPLLTILSEAAIETNNQELFKALNSQGLQKYASKLQIRHTLPWVHIKKHLSNPAAFPLSHKQESIYIQQLKLRVNLPDLASGNFALDYAIVETDLALAKFLHRNCNATLAPAIVQSAIVFAFGNQEKYQPSLSSTRAEIANYLFKEWSKSATDHNKYRMNAYLYELAVQSPISTYIILWLMENDLSFDIEYSDTHQANLPQILISNLDATNIDAHVSLLKGMLNSNINVKKLLDFKDPNGHTFVYLLLEAGMKRVIAIEDLYMLLKLCFNQNANFIDIGMPAGKNMLHLVLVLKHKELLTLTLDNLPAKELFLMLRAIDIHGKTIVDFAESQMVKHKEDPHLYNVLNEMHIILKNKYNEVVSATLMNTVMSSTPLSTAKLKA